MKILIVTSNFPDQLNPHRYVFIKKTTDELKINNNIEMKIIAPRPFYYKTKEYEEYKELIVRPVYIPLFAGSRFMSRLLSKINYFILSQAIMKGFKQTDFIPDIIYAHFLRMGICTIPLKKKLDLPLVVGSGESSFSKLELDKPIKYIKKKLEVINFFIPVSTHIQQKLVLEYKVPKDKTIVLPNAIPDFFFLKNKDKISSREKYGFPAEAFIVCFLGHFVERKGPLRVLEAIQDLDNVFGIFIGEGPQTPKGDKVIFNRKVDYADVPELLSCGDIFVFPTLAEGSSNAIIEAMACGLPIIASDIPSIREQVTSKNAILISPIDIPILRNTISKLMSNQVQLEEMGRESLHLSNAYKNSKRVKSIVEEFISIIGFR